MAPLDLASPRTPALRLHDRDSVMVALRDLPAGAVLDPEGAFRAAADVPRGHKIAIRPLPKGAPVLKFGQFIGEATVDIAVGEHVHSHNLAYRRPLAPPEAPASFDGIVRADGAVGTRNYIGVLTSVNCSATVARLVADRFRGAEALADHPHVDGVVALTHQGGCGCGSDGEGVDQLRRTLAGYARHPNFAAVLIIGLGCEANQIPVLLERQGLSAGDRLHTMVMQETGGTLATVDAAAGRIRELLADANRAVRQPVPAAHLTVALQCGGSDGFSGITANPALGAAADRVVRHGGSAVLAETPEIYGAEAMLLRRAVSREVAEKLLARIEWWHGYTARNGTDMDNNPSPGNKAGGLTTILEKSLGAAAKGGTTDLVDVLRYAEAVRRPGFHFMDTPGYDPVSVTGQIAGGCNVVCFTTGRGSCFGAKPVPSLKLATNSAMYARMADDMDIDCGEIAEGTVGVDEMGERIFRLILETASGRATRSEALGYGTDEFNPWLIGATL